MLLAAGGGGLTDLNPATVVWALISFFVTLWALSKVAWPILRDKMEEREVRIREGLEKAEEAERRAAELLERQEAVLAEAREEAQKLLADSRSSAQNIKEEMVESAQKEIAAERDRARKEIELERNKTLSEIRSTAVDLTLQAAGRVLEREINDDDHRRLAAKVIGEVDQLQ